MILIIIITSRLYGVATFTTPNHIGNSKFNPSLPASAQEKFSFILVYNTLVKLDNDHNIIPGIARHWSVNRIDREIVFEIDKNHFYSDGSLVSAKDVIDSFKFLCREKSSAAKMLRGLKGCESKSNEIGIELIEANKVKFFLTTNPTIFLHQLTSSQLPVFKKNQKGFLGSGKYYVFSFDHKQVHFKKNPYMDHDNSTLDEFIIRHVDESAVAATYLDHNWAGSLSYMKNAFFDVKMPLYKIKKDPLLITQILYLNSQKPPFDDIELRKSVYNQISLAQKNGLIQVDGEFIRGIIPRGLGGSISLLKEGFFYQSNNIPIKKLAHKKTVTISQHVGRKNLALTNVIKEILKSHNIEAKFRWYDSYKELWPLYLENSLDAFIELLAFKSRESYPVLSYFIMGVPDNIFKTNNKGLNSHILKSQEAISKSGRYHEYTGAALNIEKNAYVVPLNYAGHIGIISECFEYKEDQSNFNPFAVILSLNIRDRNSSSCRKVL